MYSWWQDKEDESQHDRGSKQDYLQSIIFGSHDINTDPDVRPGLSWMEWEERLAEASIGWVQFPKGITRKDYCLRHTFGAMERISKYTLEGKLHLIRVYTPQILSQGLNDMLERFINKIEIIEQINYRENPSI